MCITKLLLLLNYICPYLMFLIIFLSLHLFIIFLMGGYLNRDNSDKAFLSVIDLKHSLLLEKFSLHELFVLHTQFIPCLHWTNSIASSYYWINFAWGIQLQQYNIALSFEKIQLWCCIDLFTEEKTKDRPTLP